jgi:hypothetical protein
MVSLTDGPDVGGSATISLGPLELDRDILGIAALLLILYFTARNYEANRKQATSMQEIERILNPYYDIQKRSWVDPEGVDPTESNIDVVATDSIDDGEEDTEDE